MSLSPEMALRLEELFAPHLEDLGLELYRVRLIQEGGSQVLQVQIDKEGGVNLDECSDFSRRISPLLDLEEPFEFAYHLEVGSPGIFRELRNLAEFERHLLARVKIKTCKEVDGQKVFRGEMLKVSETEIVVQVEGKEIAINLEDVKKVNLDPEI